MRPVAKWLAWLKYKGSKNLTKTLSLWNLESLHQNKNGNFKRKTTEFVFLVEKVRTQPGMKIWAWCYLWEKINQNRKIPGLPPPPCLGIFNKISLSRFYGKLSFGQGPPNPSLGFFFCRARWDFLSASFDHFGGN